MCILNLISFIFFEDYAFLPIPRAQDCADGSLRIAVSTLNLQAFGAGCLAKTRTGQYLWITSFKGLSWWNALEHFCRIGWVYILLASRWCCGCVGDCGSCSPDPWQESATRVC